MSLQRKQFITIILIVFTCTLYSQDYLKSATVTGSGVTTDDSQAWSDLVTTTIDVTGVTKILVTASINMRPDGSNTQGREGQYRIYSTDLPDDSGIIRRQVKSISETGVLSWGIGTLVHIFDVSSVSSPTFFSVTLEHKNNGGASINRNVFSKARLTVVALTTTTNAYELSNDVQRINEGSEEVSSTSTDFAEVTGTVTNAISLPYKGSICVMASINGRSNAAGSIGEYQLEASTDGTNWSLLGRPVKRSMVNTWDDGIISLVGLLPNQNPGSNYQFRVAHKRISGTAPLITRNVNIVAVGLSHSGAYSFPSFYIENISGSTITGISTPDEEVTSTSFTSNNAISAELPDLFVSEQFLVSASGLDTSVNPDERMRGKNQLFLDDGSTVINEDAYYRYIPDNANFGSGGTIGLVENMTALTPYTIGMNHGVEAISSSGTKTAVLTTEEVILMGFQTFDQPSSTLSTNEELLEQGLTLFTRENEVVLRSDKLINSKIKVYNILGQLIEQANFKNENEMSIKVNYKGVIIVSIELSNGIFSKKMLLK